MEPTPAASVSAAAPHTDPASYVEGASCAACHEPETERWRGSHHDRAMQPANDSTVLGNFDNVTFHYAGLETRFFRRDGKFLISTEGPDGKPHEYEVAYTFGYSPLQQYLIAFPGGRYQALSICWDTRSREAGGQRWFHLYPQERVRAGDVLHWTSLSQNWNFQCAECHSTNLRKNFVAAGNRYATTWSEVNVSCEACHGPGSRHVAWAKNPGQGVGGSAPDKGLVLTLGVKDGAVWTVNPATGIGERSNPPMSTMEIETCARCHARRSTLTDRYEFGRALADTHRSALLDEALYFADGQIHDEVYEYGSFLQSRMYAKGVTCSDCHDPHGLTIAAPVDQACARCHLPAKFAAPAHHHHRDGSTGSSCVACHMPERTYMVIDGRRDHSFRVPRPDLSVVLDTPNSCTTCHTGKTARWAAAATRGWFGPARSAQPHYASVIHAGRVMGADAERGLAATVSDSTSPAIVRATALSLLEPMLSPASVAIVGDSLKDPDANVRAAAAESLAGADEGTRARLLPPLFSDPIRLVRINAARSAASLHPNLLTPEQTAARTRAQDEFIAVQQEQADGPGAHINLGALYAELGELDRARAEFETALSIQPLFVPASINLADVLRAQGREPDAEQVLRRALGRTPGEPDLHYALGLLLVRTKRTDDAIRELQRAAGLRPEDRRYQYVLGVAYYSSGRAREAIDLLERTSQQHPGDRDVLVALVSYTREQGRPDRALEYARRLAALLPADESVRATVAQLQAESTRH